MKRALVRTDTGEVTNVIEVTVEGTWAIPDGYELLDLPTASPGDTWDGEKLIIADRGPTVSEERLASLWQASNQWEDMIDQGRLNVVLKEIAQLLRLDHGLE